MPFCIRTEDYDPSIHEILSGPHDGPCGPSCSTDPSGLISEASLFFDNSRPIVSYSGNTGSFLTVPEGFDYAVYVNSSGQVSDEPIMPGQSISFKSEIFLGSGIFGSLVDGLLNGGVDLGTPCPEGKTKGFGYDNGGWGIVDCGCYQSASDPILVAFGGASFVRGLIKKHFAKAAIKKIINELDLQKTVRDMANGFRNYVETINSSITNLRQNIYDTAEIVLDLDPNGELVQLELSNLDSIRNALVSKVNNLIGWASPLEADDLKAYTEFVDIDRILDAGYEEIDDVISEINNLESFVDRWLDKFAIGPSKEITAAMKTRLDQFMRDMDVVKDFIATATITFAIIQNVDLVMEKICDSGLLPSLCGTQAQLNFLTCNCDQCPPNNVICPAGIANFYDDRFNTCIPVCVGGAVFEQGVSGACRCVCPPGTIFKECNSGYIPEADCGRTQGQPEGLCVDSSENEAKLRNGWRWDEEVCDFVCDRECPPGRLATIQADLCRCVCGSIEGGVFTPKNCPENQLQDSNCECCKEENYDYGQGLCKCPPERACGNTCCPEDYSCENGECLTDLYFCQS